MADERSPPCWAAASPCTASRAGAPPSCCGSPWRWAPTGPSCRPDLVMLDVNIPEPDGMDVLSASAVVLDKSRFSAVLLPHVVADAARLVGRRS